MQRCLFLRLVLAVFMCTMAAGKPLMAQNKLADEVVRELQQREQQRREQLLQQLQQQAEANPLRQLDVQQRKAINAAILNRLRILPPNGRAFTLKLVENAGKVRFNLISIHDIDMKAPHQLELSQEEEEQIVRQFVSQCEMYCDEVFQAANFTHQQLEKLNGAAALDAARLIRGLRADFSGTAEEQQAREFNPMQAYANANSELQLGITRPQSLFRKVLRTLLTAEQRAELYRSLASPLIRAVNEKLSLDAQRRKSELGYPKSEDDASFFDALKPEQQESLLKLIVDNLADTPDLLELRYQRSRLLENVSEEQLNKFLSPPQVRAVLWEKQALTLNRNIPPSIFRTTLPGRLIPVQIP